MIDNNLLKKVYYYCLRRTGNIHDAEDLTSEIMLEVLTMNDRGYSPTNFYAWLWTVAKTKYANWVKKKHLYTDELNEETILSEENIEEAIVNEETLNLLRRELSVMSKEYREITVAYYIDNKKISDIANAVNLPEGTIKRKLYESRKYLKEGMNMVRTYGKRSYAPEEITFIIQRNAPIDDTPNNLIDTRIAKNILLEAYANPCTIEELSIALGVAAPYMEEVVDKLETGLLLKKDAQNKYVTDFIILDKETQNNILNHTAETADLLFPILKWLTQSNIDFETRVSQKENTKSTCGTIINDELKWFHLFKITKDIHTFTPYPVKLYSHFKHYKGEWGLTGFEEYKHELHDFNVWFNYDQNDKDIHLFQFSNNNILDVKPTIKESELICEIIKNIKTVDDLSEYELRTIKSLEERKLISFDDKIIKPAFPVLFASELQEAVSEFKMSDVKESDKENFLKCQDILIAQYNYNLEQIKVGLPEHLHEQAKYCAKDLLHYIHNSVLKTAIDTHYLEYNTNKPLGLGMYII